MDRKRVLIFPAGTEIGLEIRQSFINSKFVEIFGGTSSPDHSEYVYKNLITGFPFVDSNGFLDYLNKVIEKYKIDYVYPAHDDVSVFLSKNKSKINATCIIADEKTTCICRSKLKTYKLFKGCDFIPKLCNAETINEFPVFAKPEIGQGSNGALKINSKDDLALIKDKPNYLLCEYLPGKEYTIDCFTDNNGKLLIAQQRTRDRIKCGIAVRSKLVETTNEVMKIAQTINDKLNFKGAWFFQLKEDKNGKLKLLEVSPRIPGTMGLTRNTNINFPLLTLFLFEEINVSLNQNKYNIQLDRAFKNIYQVNINYKHVYVDFDDTLVVDGLVNEELVMYLYQAKNNKKSIHLLSKHRKDIHEDLENYCISEKLFDEIIVISEKDEKYKHVKWKESIFIDDSFVERKKISEYCDIPVFDVDMIEALLDYKK